MKTTLCITELIDKTNVALRSKELSTEGKKALATFLEIILHDTGHYNGFTFNAEIDDERPDGPRPHHDDYYDRFYSYSHKLHKKELAARIKHDNDLKNK